MTNKLPLTLINNQTSCGECVACCVTFEIESLKKPGWTPCIYLSDDKRKPGCTIYPDRPSQCQVFRCLWLDGKVNNGKLAYRPDRLGLILLIMKSQPFAGMIGVFKKDRYGALSGRAKAFLRTLEKKQIFFFNEKLHGPTELIEKWKEQWTKKN